MMKDGGIKRRDVDGWRDNEERWKDHEDGMRMDGGMRTDGGDNGERWRRDNEEGCRDNGEG